MKIQHSIGPTKEQLLQQGLNASIKCGGVAGWFHKRLLEESLSSDQELLYQRPREGEPRRTWRPLAWLQPSTNSGPIAPVVVAEPVLETCLFVPDDQMVEGQDRRRYQQNDPDGLE